MTKKIENILQQFDVHIQKMMTYKCSCGKQLHRMCTYHLKFDISYYTHLTRKDEKEIGEQRYKIYYRCDELSCNDRYIGMPYGLGYKTVEEAAEELKRYL